MLTHLTLEKADLKIRINIVRSQRRTLCLEIKPDLTINARIPHYLSDEEVQKFIEEKSGWVVAKYKQITERKEQEDIVAENRKSYDAVTVQYYRKRAKEIITEKVRYYESRMDVKVNHITIREQKTRWGSCSTKGNVNFNWKLILMPEEILDYVIVHELAHLKEMNHSAEFWDEVAAVIPDYKKHRQWLKENGSKY